MRDDATGRDRGTDPLGGLDRLAPLAGALAVVVGIISFLVGGDPADTDAPAAELVDFWSEDKQMLSAALGAISGALIIAFGTVLREALRVADHGRERLATLAFAGALAFGIGLAAASGFAFAAADSAGDVAPQVTQTLAVLNEDFFFPMAVGLSLLLLATGRVALRSGLLPAWFGWLSVVLGVLALTPLGFFAFLAGLVWIIAVSVILFMRGYSDPVVPVTAAAPVAPAAAAPPAAPPRDPLV